MPELCRFRGIVIQLYYSDHARPHFHARHNEHSVTVGISDLVPYKGSLSSRDWRLVRAWAIARRQELLEAWERAERKQDPGKIDPLD